MVSAYAAEQNLCLGQTVVDKKHDEIVAIPEILELIAVKGCTVTIEAMGCQKKIAKTIIEKEGNYVLMVKDNQKELKEQVEKLFELHTDKEPDETLDSGHVRIKTRKCEMTDDLKFLDDKEQ